MCPDTAAQAILITDDADFAEAVERTVEVHLQHLPRSEIARASWEGHGAVILVPDFEAAVPLVDRIAPEHLELAVSEPDALAQKIRNAGAIFLGRHTPEVIGDYVAGPNHVLPTARSARFSSGLSVLDFMKRSSLIGVAPEGLAAIGPAAVILAEAEGLDAHALSVQLRLDAKSGD
jgi:histidinol dehydrogenase